MATKKFMSLERLREYDALIKEKIDNDIENHVHTWGELEDKPFGEPINEVLFSGLLTTSGSKLSSGIGCNEEYLITINGIDYKATSYEGISPAYAPTLKVASDDGCSITIEYDDIGIDAVSEITSAEVTVAKKGNDFTKLDEKYIPDTIARLEDVPEGFSGSWNDLTDKPFWEEGDPTKEDEIVLDANLEIWGESETTFTVENSALELFGTVGNDVRVVATRGYNTDAFADGTFDCKVQHDEMNNYNFIEFGDAKHRIYVNEANNLTFIYNAYTAWGEYNLKIAKPVYFVKPLEERFIPKEIARVDDFYKPQQLSEEQQMQARKNLGLPYVSYKKNSIAYQNMIEAGGWDGNHMQTLYVPESGREAPDSIQMKVVDDGLRETIFDGILQKQCKVTNLGNDFWAGFWWYGNLNLITDELDSEAKTVIRQLGLSETLYSDVQFVYYKYSPEDYGEIGEYTTLSNKFKLIFSDDLTPSDSMFGYSINIYDSTSEGTPVYTPLEEQYIPKISWENISDKPFGEVFDELIFSDGMNGGESKKLNRSIKSYKNYHISVDGYEYEVVSTEYTPQLSVNTDIGIDIFIENDTITLYDNEEYGWVWVDIVEKEAGISTLDEQCIPDTIARTSYVDENFALKSDLQNIDLSEYETKDDAQAKLDEAKLYTDTMTSGMATTTVVDNKVSAHNSSSEAHTDIRDLISELSTKVNNFLDVDDATTDQLSEVLTLINNNKGTLDSITSSKVNVSDIVDNLTTANANKVLSANQGVALKSLIDALQEAVDGKAAGVHTHAISEVTNLQDTLDAKASQTDLDSHVADTTKHITSDERTNWNTAKSHADSAHAPSNAQANVIESIKVNGTAQTVTSKSVNITVPTDATDIGAAPATHSHTISDITDLQTTLNSASSAIGANTSSINAHTDRISALETKVGDGFEEITSAEIQALFAN